VTNGAPITVSATTVTLVPDTALASFRTPTGNIGCFLDRASARCDIHDHTYSAPPKPADCDLEWGDAIQIRGGPAAFVCHGDTALDPSASVLAYGARTRQGSMVCESAENGVTCFQEGTGNHFFISRQVVSLS